MHRPLESLKGFEPWHRRPACANRSGLAARDARAARFRLAPSGSDRIRVAPQPLELPFLPTIDFPVIATTIRDMLTRDPFEPFRIVSSSGEAFIVRDPQTVALMKSEVFIAQPRSDRRTFIPYLHIATVETMTNGHAPRRSRRR